MLCNSIVVCRYLLDTLCRYKYNNLSQYEAYKLHLDIIKILSNRDKHDEIASFVLQDNLPIGETNVIHKYIINLNAGYVLIGLAARDV